MDDLVILKQGQLAVYEREQQDLNPVENCNLLTRPLDCMIRGRVESLGVGAFANAETDIFQRLRDASESLQEPAVGFLTTPEGVQAKELVRGMHVLVVVAEGEHRGVDAQMLE